MAVWHVTYVCAFNKNQFYDHFQMVLSEQYRQVEMCSSYTY